MSVILRACLAPLLLMTVASTSFAATPDDLLTVAEKSDFKATARHAEVVDLCERLAKSSPSLIRLIELGRSGEGRSLPLMIISDPPVSTPEEARKSGKLVVFLFGNIHAGRGRRQGSLADPGSRSGRDSQSPAC